MKFPLKSVSERVGQFTGFPMLKIIRKNIDLYPIAALHVFAVTIAILTAARTLLKSPDVIVDPTKKEMPFERLWTPDDHAVRYKLFSFQNYDNWKPDPDRPSLEESDHKPLFR